MNEEFKIISGEIQFIKEDNKSFLIEGIWYNNKFKTLPKEIIKGSNVKVKFVLKGKNNYWQEIKPLAIPCKPLINLEKEKLNNESKSTNEKPKEQITNQTFNTILINAREIYLTLKTITIEEATNLAYRSYKSLNEK
jgi:hypothetical protein